MSDDRLHAILSILDAGSRGQWPSKEWSDTGGDEIVKQGYEAVLEIYNRRGYDATETEALRKVRDSIKRAQECGPCLWDKWLAALDAILKERE